MMMGHYSAAFLAKRFAPALPLWLAFVAVMLVDIAWACFIVIGVERVSFDATLASNPLVLEHMPYTHSLAANLAWAALAFFAVRVWLGSRAASLAAGLAVLSHWFADLLVHRPDLTLAGGGTFGKLGFALWNQPWLALALELGLLAAAAHVCVTGDGPLRAARPRLAWLVGGMAALQAGMLVAGAAPATSVAGFAASSLALFALLPVLAAWAARPGESPPTR
jgi:hypothetical protein